MVSLTQKKIAAVDSENMFKLVRDFPNHWQKAMSYSKDQGIKVDISRVRNIMISGMGGSAISGDLIGAYVEDRLPIPLIVNRHYRLANWVREDTLFIGCSYSGNTEETLTATNEALGRGAQVIVMTSGGALLDLAQKRDLQYIKIPGGLPPRAALAYKFIPLYQFFRNVGFIEEDDNPFSETLNLLLEQNQSYQNFEENEALSLAETVKDTLCVIYSDGKLMAPVNVRWRTQFEENAKTLCYGGVLPEMNHNEIVGWENVAHLTGRLSVIFLRDKEDDPRVTKRINVTREIIEESAASVHTFRSRGESRMARMFSLIQFGDWVSLYLALITNTDPTPIVRIDLLKRKLAEV
ncbi:MAG TPA: bifunctional phosphoglucose/phosphomannose isomerase [Balneolales bacterium]|nr:bifunctional phosphoglucose/phosphomannose isomerase [Balneolales bacterium]